MNLKALEEKRAELQARMVELATITEGADGVEARALGDEERAEFEKLENEIRAIDDSIAIAEKARKVMNAQPARTETEDRAEAEERAFVDYIMGRTTELRSGEQNMSMGNNGAIIPTSIANRIIKKVKDLCPILRGCTMFSVKGTLKIPVWGKANTTHDIAVGWATEFSDLTADSGAFTSVDLTGFLAGALTLIGRSVENNAVFNVTDFIIDQMGEEIAAFIENKLLNGAAADSKNIGALSTTNTLNAESVSAISFNNLIELQAKVKQVYQPNACWTMNPATFTAIKELKDLEGRYLIQNDVTKEFPYMLLGKPVYLSDNMPTIASAAKAVLYGDYSGLAVNFRENISVEVLREKYATQHAIGVVSWFEFDSKVMDSQRLAALVMSVTPSG